MTYEERERLWVWMPDRYNEMGMWVRGGLTRWADCATEGAVEVVRIDVVERMVAEARQCGLEDAAKSVEASGIYSDHIRDLTGDIRALASSKSTSGSDNAP